MRKIADCRTFPSEAGCSLAISGTEEEVLAAAVAHAISVHGHEDTAELRDQVRATLVDEGAAGRYGTVMVATLTGAVDDVRKALAAWAERAPSGFLAEEVLLGADGTTVVTPVFFASKADYDQLSGDPGQGQWWTERMAPHVTDVRWIDGTWQQALAPTPVRA